MLERDKYDQISLIEQKKNDLFLVLYDKQIKEMESKIVTRSHEINKLFLDINQKNKEMKRIKE